MIYNLYIHVPCKCCIILRVHTNCNVVVPTDSVGSVLMRVHTNCNVVVPTDSVGSVLMRVHTNCNVVVPSYSVGSVLMSAQRGPTPHMHMQRLRCVHLSECLREPVRDITYLLEINGGSEHRCDSCSLSGSLL